jgi:hypothetical protein
MSLDGSRLSQSIFRSPSIDAGDHPDGIAFTAR